MTLKQQWENYVAAVLPPTAPLVQQTETQRAFYAGATAMFDLVMRSADGTDDESEAALAAIQAELEAFAARVGTPYELPALPPEIEAAYEVKDAPIQDRLRQMGRAIQRGLPPGWAFTLFLFTLGEGGSMFYLSSAERTSMLKALHEFIARQIPTKGGN